MKKLMIYGATGYTGALAAEYAASIGLDLIVAGRARNRPALEALARRLGAEARVFDLHGGDALEGLSKDVSVVLNAAGPFVETAEFLMSIAIRANVHYLDFSAELSSYRQALALSDEAQVNGVMLMPGSGGSVAMLGSLAGHAASRVPEPRSLSIALEVTGSMSKGSVATAGMGMAMNPLKLINGNLVTRSPDEVRDFDFGRGPRSSFPVTLPDLLTLHHMTGIGNIETFVHISEGEFSTSSGDAPTAGPTPEERAANRYRATAEVTGADGRAIRSSLSSVNGYTFTAMASAKAARRVLAGEYLPGFQTPAGLFGYGFALTIADTTITDFASQDS